MPKSERCIVIAVTITQSMALLLIIIARLRENLSLIEA